MFQADQGHWSSWALGKKQGFVKQFSWRDMIHWRKGGLKDVPPLNPRRSRYRWNVTCHVWWTGISWPCTFVWAFLCGYMSSFLLHISMATVKSLLNAYADFETWKGRHIYLCAVFETYWFYLSACMFVHHTHEIQCSWTPERGLDLLKLELQFYLLDLWGVMWLLVTKPGPWGRAISTLNPWTISPSLQMYSL